MKNIYLNIYFPPDIIYDSNVKYIICTFKIQYLDVTV